jgi:hypothetical protein
MTLSEDEMLEFEELLNEMSPEELTAELKFLEAIGKAKQKGKNLVVIDHYYDM